MEQICLLFLYIACDYCYHNLEILKSVLHYAYFQSAWCCLLWKAQLLSLLLCPHAYAIVSLILIIYILLNSLTQTLWKCLVCAIIPHGDFYLANFVSEIVSVKEGKPFSICKHKVPGQYCPETLYLQPSRWQWVWILHFDWDGWYWCENNKIPPCLQKIAYWLCIWQCSRYLFIPCTENMLHLENITKYDGFWL